jgi:hypothetical protein
MKLEVGTKASRVMACAMEEENFTIKMEDSTKASGRTIKWMAMVNSTTKEVS